MTVRADPDRYGEISRVVRQDGPTPSASAETTTGVGPLDRTLGVIGLVSLLFLALLGLRLAFSGRLAS